MDGFLQEPPQDNRIFNRRQPDGTFRPLSEFFTVQKFTGIKYDEDCGYYAVRNGRIVCPADGISGQKSDAERALAWASIDWWEVERLTLEDKCVDENPAYLSIPF